METLKLIALDAEDLGVISAHLQDSVLRVGDLVYLRKERRFATVLNRFNWAQTAESGSGGRRGHERRRAGLRFERVRGAKLQGIDLKDKEAVLSLLAIGFQPAGPDDAAGHVTLVFSGGAAILLEVECVEVELKDLGAAWRTKTKPDHPGGDATPEA